MHCTVKRLCLCYFIVFFQILFEFSAAAVFVKRRIAGVEILAVQLVGCKPESFTVTIKIEQRRIKGSGAFCSYCPCKTSMRRVISSLSEAFISSGRYEASHC